MDLRLSGPFTHHLPPPALDPEDIHFWLENLHSWPDPTPSDYDNLSPAEKKRANSFHFTRDRRRFILSRKFLRLACAQYLHLPPAQIQFSLTSFGKPFIHPEPSADLRFNISHAGDMLLAAFTLARDIGADIESIDSHLDISSLSDLCFSPPEQQSLQQLPPSAQPPAFLRNWALKEAYTKALGLGHQQPFNELHASLEPADVPFVRPLNPAPNFPSDFHVFEPSLPDLNGHVIAIVCQSPR